MNKKMLAMLLALTMGTTSIALANPVTDANDSAYVERTKVADNVKAKAEASTVKDIREIDSKLAAPVLSDKDATPEAVALYKYLRAIPATNHVIYGHQNDVHHKMFRPEGGSESDTKDVTGSIAGVVGFDALSFVGDELRLNECEWNMGVTYVDKMVDITKKAADDGAILTLSMHMPNFDLVAKKAKVTGSNDYQGYSTHISEGKVVHRILPGGDLNSTYNGYLDLVADYANKMQAAKIPIIFRPLHEQNGYWFWWGKTHSSEKDFQKLWEYTVTYLRDTKGVHNFLYAFSPNGPFSSTDEYLDRYPGDEWVDIMGIDSYDDDQNGSFFTNMERSLGVMTAAAKEHNKLIAMTEVGVRDGGSLAVTGNKDRVWFSKVANLAAKYKVPYFMTWSNFEKLPHNFFAPYMVSKTRGHELVNEFVDFYNEPVTIFADGIADYRALEK